MTNGTSEDLAFCGIACAGCGLRTKKNCPGCRKARGQVFWGKCELAVCCIEKGLEHCGRCEEFPCAKLREYSFDAKHGDNGRRIENLRQAVRG